MTEPAELKARLLSGRNADAEAVLALAAGHGISLPELLRDTLLEKRLDRWIQTGEHIDSMFEDDHLFTHFFGSDGRFDMKIRGFSYYDSAVTSEKSLQGRWRLAGITPVCFVLQLEPDGTAESPLFFVSTADCAELLPACPDIHSADNRWMQL